MFVMFMFRPVPRSRFRLPISSGSHPIGRYRGIVELGLRTFSLLLGRTGRCLGLPSTIDFVLFLFLSTSSLLARLFVFHDWYVMFLLMLLLVPSRPNIFLSRLPSALHRARHLVLRRYYSPVGFTHIGHLVRRFTTSDRSSVLFNGSLLRRIGRHFLRLLLDRVQH